MIETLALVFLRQTFPIELRCLKQSQRTHDISACEGERILYASVNMTLGSKMDDAIDVLILHQLIESIEVADVHLYKLIVRLILNVLKVSQVAGISQLIKADDIIFRVFVHEEANNVRADKTSTTGNHYISFHYFIC